MGRLVGLGWFVLLIALINVEAQRKASINIRSQCLGNIMLVEAGPLGGNLLEVSAVINNTAIPLTPSIAAQCGFSVTINQLGHAMIYASLQNCFAENVNDKAFTTTINLLLHGNQMDEGELYQVAETCYYTTWASREIICERNYMEVSVKRASQEDYVLPGHPAEGDNPKFGDPRRQAEERPIESRITTLVFYTPEERIMKVGEAQRNGYGVASTATRLLLRSPTTSPETYTQSVAGVPMTVFKTSTVFEKKWLATQIDAAAACPILDGGVSFTQNTITWFLPRHTDPLISSGQFQLLEVHMGVDGQRLDAAEMAARGYSLTVTDGHVIVEVPVGSVGGYYKVGNINLYSLYTVKNVRRKYGKRLSNSNSKRP